MGLKRRRLKARQLRERRSDGNIEFTIRCINIVLLEAVCFHGSNGIAMVLSRPSKNGLLTKAGKTFLLAGVARYFVDGVISVF